MYRYNKAIIDHLISYIYFCNGIYNKVQLAHKTQIEFDLKLTIPVYHCNDFAIRFSQSQKERPSNTVLALSKLRNYYDSVPFIECIVTPTKNYLMLANTTFLIKLSHSSPNLTADHITGSFNVSNIMREYCGLKNVPENFEALFALHCKISFQRNLSRIVESTKRIKPRSQKFVVTPELERTIMDAPRRASDFLNSNDYLDLKRDLDGRVQAEREAIVMAVQDPNGKTRGDNIEYLITSLDPELTEQIIHPHGNNLSEQVHVSTKNNLGDYSKSYPSYVTETDIKTKILSKKSNPKGSNIDKLLEFLSDPRSVYLIYIVGIDGTRISTRLISVFDERLIRFSAVQNLWSGKDTRGTVQFEGESLAGIISEPDCHKIDTALAEQFLRDLIER